MTKHFSGPKADSKSTEAEASVEAFIDHYKATQAEYTSPEKGALSPEKGALSPGTRISAELQPDVEQQQPQQYQQQDAKPDVQKSSKSKRKKRKSHPDYGQTDSDASEQVVQLGDEDSQQSAPGSTAATIQAGHDEHDAGQRPDALRQRICPAFGTQYVRTLSLCHVPDHADDASCVSKAECGIDSVSCRARVCTVHGSCRTD